LPILKKAKMKVIINSTEKEVEENLCVYDLMQMLNLPENGVALAINSTMVPKDKYKQTLLKENDNILIIKASCGG